ncbi:MAG: ABC-F family ATP-binding cassette domain-containing protein, partial [Mesorhizobium sp.]
MALISLKSLGVTMSAPLFSNLDLIIGAGDRLGIVAANGRGKSTLLRCLAGELDATTGDITRTRGLRVGHVEQSVPGALLDRSFHQVVADVLPPEQLGSELWRVDVVLDSLDVPEEMRDRPMRALSGGWQRLAMITGTSRGSALSQVSSWPILARSRWLVGSSSRSTSGSVT